MQNLLQNKSSVISDSFFQQSSFISSRMFFLSIHVLDLSIDSFEVVSNWTVQNYFIDQRHKSLEYGCLRTFSQND